jgi:TfoX/Sxy family transcriptional regulator of competence genes
LDQIDDKKAWVRAMFGEFALYYGDKVVGLICDNTLFLKITESSSKYLGDNKTGPAYKGAKPSYIIPEEILEDTKFLKKIVLGIYEDLPTPKKKSKKLKNP